METPITNFDEVGYWSELKLEIIREYATAYSTILNYQRSPSFFHVYIDGFAGAGVHLSKRTGKFILGSPLNALEVKPPFKAIFLIDLDGKKTQQLRKLTKDDTRVTILNGDCNEILLKEVFPQVKYRDYRRGLCLLDPYGLQLNWNVIEEAGKMKSLDIFINFPVMDMNRNTLWRNPEKVPQTQIERMTSFWGDDEWREAAYETVPTLFEDWEVKKTNDDVVEAYCKRLKNIAKFKHVADPLPMRNSKGAIVYYLIFASQKHVANNIIKNIFNKFKNQGAG